MGADKAQLPTYLPQGTKMTWLETAFQERTKKFSEQKNKVPIFPLFRILRQGFDSASTYIKMQSKFTLKGPFTSVFWRGNKE